MIHDSTLAEYRMIVCMHHGDARSHRSYVSEFATVGQLIQRYREDTGAYPVYMDGIQLNRHDWGEHGDEYLRLFPSVEGE